MLHLNSLQSLSSFSDALRKQFVAPMVAALSLSGTLPAAETEINVGTGASLPDLKTVLKMQNETTIVLQDITSLPPSAVVVWPELGGVQQSGLQVRQGNYSRHDTFQLPIASFLSGPNRELNTVPIQFSQLNNPKPDIEKANCVVVRTSEREASQTIVVTSCHPAASSRVLMHELAQISPRDALFKVYASWEHMELFTRFHELAHLHQFALGIQKSNNTKIRHRSECEADATAVLAWKKLGMTDEIPNLIRDLRLLGAIESIMRGDPRSDTIYFTYTVMDAAILTEPDSRTENIADLNISACYERARHIAAHLHVEDSSYHDLRNFFRAFRSHTLHDRLHSLRDKIAILSGDLKVITEAYLSAADRRLDLTLESSGNVSERWKMLLEADLKHSLDPLATIRIERKSLREIDALRYDREASKAFYGFLDTQENRILGGLRARNR